MSDAVTGTPEDQAHEDDAPEALDAPPGPTGSPASQDGAYCVATDAFEGPLDLLLYLIRKEQVSVYDIPIARITEQYLGTLKLMQELNLDVAGDFLVMAATLLQIKSRMLLPQPPELDGDEEGEGLDPRAELVRALLEFERYRQVAADLSERPRLGRDAFPRGGAPDDALGEDETVDVSAGLFDLVAAFRTLVDRIGGTTVHQVLLEPVTIRDRIVDLLDRLPAGKTLLFEELFRPYGEAHEGARARLELVVTFLAVLELIRMQVIRAVQPRAFGPIEIERSVVAAEQEQRLAEQLDTLEE